MLELGPTEQSIAKQAIRSGEPLPDRIANAPELEKGLEIYLQAFFDLDADRQIGWDRGRIPWSVITQYAMYYELDADQTDLLHSYIRAMDIAYLNSRKKD